MLLNENIKVDLSFFSPDLSQGNSVYPPNLYPFVVSINVIVIPLLSHLLWKSFGVEPSLDFLYNNSVLNVLWFNQNLTKFSSKSIFELNKLPCFISPNILIVFINWLTPSSLGKNLKANSKLFTFVIAYNLN